MKKLPELDDIRVGFLYSKSKIVKCLNGCEKQLKEKCCSVKPKLQAKALCHDEDY